jgi:hypothetical protein
MEMTEGEGNRSGYDIDEVPATLLPLPKHHQLFPDAAGPKATKMFETAAGEAFLTAEDEDTPEASCDEAVAALSKANPSRVGKKKRRKQLKLAKKAAAAAAAAAALTHFGSMVATSRNDSSSSGSRHGSATGSGSNQSNSNTSKFSGKRQASKSRKQVANIAVACAAASYASYREECLLRKTKK